MYNIIGFFGSGYPPRPAEMITVSQLMWETGRKKYMTVIEINDINATVYASYMGEDMAEKLGREYYRGLAVISDEDGSLAAGLVWEYC